MIVQTFVSLRMTAIIVYKVVVYLLPVPLFDSPATPQSLIIQKCPLQSWTNEDEPNPLLRNMRTNGCYYIRIVLCLAYSLSMRNAPVPRYKTQKWILFFSWPFGPPHFYLSCPPSPLSPTKKNALGFVDPVRVDVFKWLTQVSPTCRSLAHPFPPLPPPSASVHGANQFNHGPFFYSFFFNTKERKNWNTLIIDHFIYPFTFLLVLSLIFNFQVFFSILFEVIPPRTSGQLSTKKKQPFRGNLYTNFFFSDRICWSFVRNKIFTWKMSNFVRVCVCVCLYVQTVLSFSVWRN